MRTVITHLHLFKNAGTSVERSLKQHFGDTWVSYDGDHPGEIVDQHRLSEFLMANRSVNAVSSHQLRPPLDSTNDLQFVPLVYLRHPIDRIRSAYDFEREQGQVSPSSRAAARLDFASWIQYHHDKNSSQCHNFQAYALTSLRSPAGAPLVRHPDSEHLASTQDLLRSLPAFGLVETFEDSWAQISAALQRYFPSFDAAPTRANARTGKKSRLPARLASVEADLGAKAFADLTEMNALDLALYDWAADHLETRSSGR